MAVAPIPAPQDRNVNRLSGNVAFRSAKEHPFAERKATLIFARRLRAVERHYTGSVRTQEAPVLVLRCFARPEAEIPIQPRAPPWELPATAIDRTDRSDQSDRSDRKRTSASSVEPWLPHLSAASGPGSKSAIPKRARRVSRQWRHDQTFVLHPFASPPPCRFFCAVCAVCVIPFFGNELRRPFFE